MNYEKLVNRTLAEMKPSGIRKFFDIAAEMEDVKPDLGGVRVRGRVLVETLVSSGAPGRTCRLNSVSQWVSQIIMV